MNLANVANLITGTGLGIAVNSLQFSNSTSELGNGIGVGSGVASTLFSIVGMRLQRGPQGRIPNMLARRLGRERALNSYYPQDVMKYCKAYRPPKARLAGHGLNSSWRNGGRLAWLKPVRTLEAA